MGKGQRGFTLVELMVASLLAGIVLVIALPLILVGRNTDVRTEKKEAVALAGEAIYEYIADEMKFAGQLYIGDLQDKKPVGENWKSITVSEKDPEAGESYARLLHGSARELTADGSADPGKPLYDETYQEKTDLVIEAEAVGQNQLRLTVKLMDEDQALYEKTSVLSLLNLTLNATHQIEGYVGGPMTTAVSSDAAEGMNEEGEALKSPDLNSLVLWYKSSRETVSPFVEGDLGEGEADGLIPSPGAAVVSLANPQYVKAGQISELQYKVQAGSGQSIEKYVWSIVDGTNDTGDGSSYINAPQWDQATKKYMVEGLSITLDNHVVTLALTVFFKDENGSETSLTDSCGVIVYEGDKPGEGPVDHFVIVPYDLEDEYKNEPEDVPVWIKKGTSRVLILDAIDKNGELTKYDVNRWGHPNDGLGKKWLGFNNGYNHYENFTADDKRELYDFSLSENKKITLKNDFKHYMVEIRNINIGNSNNQIKIFFGNNNEAAYKAPGQGVSISRAVCVYDPVVKLSYSRENDNEYTLFKDTDEVNMFPGEKEIRLLAELSPNTAPGTSDLKVPQIDTDSIEWNLERDGDITLISKQDTCSLKVGDGEEGNLRIGGNRVKVTFKDTAGYSYSNTITVTVPSEVAYVKFKEDSYTLVNMDQEIDGISSKEIEYDLYDVNGEILYNGLDDVNIKDIYTIDWSWTPEDKNDCPFSLVTKNNTAKVKTNQEGKGNLTLRLIEKESNREILGEDGEPCTCTIDVFPMDLQLKLRYKNGNSWDDPILSTSIESGKIIPVFSSTVGMIKGFDAEIKLPSKVEGNLTPEQSKILDQYDWKKVRWSKTGSLFSGEQDDKTNIYSINHNWGTGTVKFQAVSNMDSGLIGEVSVVVNEAPVNSIAIQNVGGTGNELVIGAGAHRPDDQYNSITLKADIKGEGGQSCDKSVIWTIRSGKELVDTSKSVWNIEVDSENEDYYPVIRLKSELTEEDAGKKIEIRATSASSGIYAKYEITLLPQFTITYPYNQSFNLVHTSDGDKNDFSDTKKLESNRSAKWTIDGELFMLGGVPTKALKFANNMSEGNSITVETIGIKSIPEEGTSLTVTATDILTGQMDSRAVTVFYSEAQKDDKGNSGFAFHFTPKGTIDLNSTGDGSSLDFVIKSFLDFELSTSGDDCIEILNYKRDWGFFKGYVGNGTIKARYPGTVTIKATWSSWLFGTIESAEYIKIIIPGLQFSDELSDEKESTVNLSEKTKDLKRFLKHGDIEIFNWESSNNDVAKVSENGVLTFANPGKTVITVTGYDSKGTKYTTECEITVKDEGWDAIKTVTSKWKDYEASQRKIQLLAGALTDGKAEIETFINGGEGNQKWKYYEVRSKISGTEAKEILKMEGDYAVAVGEGEAEIHVGAADAKETSPLTVKVYELKNISIKAWKQEKPEEAAVSSILNFITEGPKEIRLSADFNWGSDLLSNIPERFKGYTWELDEKSKEYVDITTNSDGTCTVTAKGMGAAYITCRSLANPDIYETYVVIVSF